MRSLAGRRSGLVALCSVLIASGLATPAKGVAPDPDFVFVPIPPPPPAAPKPPPTGYFNGPCGLGVDSASRFYVSDYYHHAVDIYSATGTYTNPSSNASGYVGQLANEDPLDGPCGLAFDASNHLYVNNFHRNVVKFNPFPSFGAGTVFPLPAEDRAHHLPTGVAVDGSSGDVYVDNRTYISVYDSSGSPVEEGAEPLRIGLGSLEEGYGVALSEYPGTLGRLYVPDASTNTVKIYDPAVDAENPVATIEGPFSNGFVSLRDSAVAIDRHTGEVYVADNTQPQYTEQPQATIQVFSSTGIYEGHLKYNIVDTLPPGLAVDNTSNPTQGRVYVTSGNTSSAAVYAYPPGAAILGSSLPPVNSVALAPGGGVPGPGAVAAQGAPEGSGGAAVVGASDAPVATASEIAQKENLRVAVNGKLSPKKLPREGAAPISVEIGWTIETTDESPPPKLKTLRIEINRNGRFDYTGLPTCPYTRIQPATTQRALSNCRAALVGSGSFSAEIALAGQEAESYEVKGRLLVFNGESHGKPVLFGQIYSAHPFATSFVITFKVSKIASGAYGTALSATLPKALRSWGNLTGIEMKLSRRYGYGGHRHSYLSAGCPAPKGFFKAVFPLARTSFSFAGGTKLSSVFASTCKAR